MIDTQEWEVITKLNFKKMDKNEKIFYNYPHTKYSEDKNEPMNKISVLNCLEQCRKEFLPDLMQAYIAGGGTKEDAIKYINDEYGHVYSGNDKVKQLAYDAIDFFRILEEDGYLRIPDKGYYRQVIDEMNDYAERLGVNKS